MNQAIETIVRTCKQDYEAAQAKLDSVRAIVKFLAVEHSREYVQKSQEQQAILHRAQQDAEEAQRHYQAAAEAASTLN